MALISKAQMLKYAAMAAREATKTGISVGFGNLAQATFRQAQLTKSPFEMWRPTLETIRMDIDHIQRTCQLENEMVAFAQVADSRMLEMPEPRSLVTSIPFTPSRLPIQIV